jgi:hypothetical protein
MKYETRHGKAKIEIQEAEEEDWLGNSGYEVKITPKGCETASSIRNYPNATKALEFAKDQIDSGKVPIERKKLFGIF